MRSKTILATSIFALAMSAGTAFAAGGTFMNGNSFYGKPSAEMKGNLVVDVATAKTLNVKCGDTVTFVNGAKRFSWRFETTPHSGVPLAKIAPADFGAGATTVYVARNDMERGS
jgi:hypothetical protein